MKAIGKLKEQRAYEDNFDEHMGKAMPGSYAPIYEDALWGLSIHLLEMLCEDKFETIDWWVWETDFGEIGAEISWTEEDGTQKEAVLNSAEKLYDYLQVSADWPEVEKPKTFGVTIDLEDPDNMAEEHYIATVDDSPQIRADGSSLTEVTTNLRKELDAYFKQLQASGKPIPEFFEGAQAQYNLTPNAMIREMVKGFCKVPEHK